MINNNFVLIRDKVNAATNAQELSDAIAFGMNNSQWLSDEHQGVLKSMIDTRKIALGLPRPETAIAEDGTTPTPAERVAAEYKEDDAKNFTPITIEMSNTPTTVSPWVDLAPSSTVDTEPWIDDTPKWKRTRKAKEEPAALQIMYRVKRRVNKPIDWVQYSNNEYEVEVSSTDQVTLLSELDAIEKEVIGRLSLYNKDALDKQKELGYQQGVKEATEKIKATPVKVEQAPAKNIAWAPVEYDISQVSKIDVEYATMRYQRLNGFVLQLFNHMPEVKALYAEFDKVNPKVITPTTNL